MTKAITQEGQALVKRETGAIVQVPEYLRERMGDKTGNEGVGQDDLLIPRLAIAQEGMSPQLKKHNENFIPGLEAGDLFNTVTGEVYGNSVKIVPLFFFKNFIEFVPMNQGGGVVAMYDRVDQVPADKLRFGKDAQNATVPPVVTEFKNRMCLLLQEGQKPQAIVVSFKSSGLKAAKKWNSLIMATNLPAFARSYDLKVVTKVKGQQSWFILDVQPGEFVPEVFFNQAQEYFDSLQKGGYKVDTTGIEQEREAGSDDATSF